MAMGLEAGRAQLASLASLDPFPDCDFFFFFFFFNFIIFFFLL